MKEWKDEESISFFTQRNCGSWFQTTNFSPLHMSRWPPTSHTAIKFCLFTISLLHSSSEASENHPALNKEQADIAAHPWGLGTTERFLSVQGWRRLLGTHMASLPRYIWHGHSNLCSVRPPESPPRAPKERAKEAWMFIGPCWLDHFLISDSQCSTALFSVWDFNHHESYTVQKIQECSTVLHWCKHHHYKGWLPTGFSSISGEEGALPPAHLHHAAGTFCCHPTIKRATSSPSAAG